MIADVFTCFVCEVKADQKTSEFCCGDINSNLLSPVVMPDWKHIWTDGKEVTGWKREEQP